MTKVGHLAAPTVAPWLGFEAFWGWHVACSALAVSAIMLTLSTSILSSILPLLLASAVSQSGGTVAGVAGAGRRRRIG